MHALSAVLCVMQGTAAVLSGLLTTICSLVVAALEETNTSVEPLSF
jgi:hypothetical protein